MTKSVAELYGELVVTERVALVLWRIFNGEELTTRQIAQHIGITERGALEMMNKISRVVPVYQTGWY